MQLYYQTSSLYFLSIIYFNIFFSKFRFIYVESISNGVAEK